MRLRISEIDLSSQFDPIIKLMGYSQISLMDLELSWCNLNLQNFCQLAQCFKMMTKEDAE